MPPEINPKIVFLLVILQFFANFFLNIDMGILPAGSTAIKEEMELDNIKFGTLGSVVYFGQMLGSIMATWTFRQCNPKYILCGCLALNIASLILFTLTNQYFILLICRILTGVFQVSMCIYFPVWADVYGSKI